MTKKNEPRDPLEALRALLVELNLTTVAKRLSEILTQAETSHPAYSEFLREALEAEQEARWERTSRPVVHQPAGPIEGSRSKSSSEIFFKDILK